VRCDSQRNAESERGVLSCVGICKTIFRRRRSCFIMRGRFVDSIRVVDGIC